MIDQLGRLAQADAALHQAGSATAISRERNSSHVVQVGLQRRLAVDHADIGVVGVEIPAAMAGAQAQAQLGVGGLEAVQPRQQPARGDRDVDLQRDLAGARPPAQMRGRLADAGEGLAQHRKQQGPGLGQLDPSPLAPEQRPAQLALEILDLMADRGMGHAQLLAGLAEAQMARRRLERAQGGERRQARPRRHEVAHSGSR